MVSSNMAMIRMEWVTGEDGVDEVVFVAGSVDYRAGRPDDTVFSFLLNEGWYR